MNKMVTVQINMRINSDEKKRLAEIAKAQGLSLSAFLRSAATAEARKVIALSSPENKHE